MRIPLTAASSLQTSSLLGYRNISFTLEFQPSHPSSLVAYSRFHQNCSAVLKFRNEPVTFSSTVLPTSMSAHFPMAWRASVQFRELNRETQGDTGLGRGMPSTRAPYLLYQVLHIRVWIR